MIKKRYCHNFLFFCSYLSTDVFVRQSGGKKQPLRRSKDAVSIALKAVSILKSCFIQGTESGGRGRGRGQAEGGQSGGYKQPRRVPEDTSHILQTWSHLPGIQLTLFGA